MMDDSALLVTSAAGVTRQVSLASCLEPAAIESSEREANRWVKALRHARVDGQSFRDRFTYRDDSLWWFAELYLHKQRVIVDIFRTIHALEQLIARGQPVRIEDGGGSRVLRILGPQMARGHGVEWRQKGGHRAGVAPRIDAAARSLFYAASALVDRVRPSSGKPGPGGVQVAAFVHSAFWRRDAGGEAYIGPVLDAVSRALGEGAVHLVGLGPRTNFRARGWRQRWAEFRDPRARALPLTPVETYASWKRIQPSLAVWRNRSAIERSLHASEDLRRAATIRGLDAWPLVRDELTGISHLQFPWAARAMDEASAALDVLKPEVVVTYAEAGGWGRALLAEARRRGIPSVGLQHGFIYRHWLNYLHEADEMEASPGNAADCGFPRPDLTLVYDRFAARHLLEAGRFPAAAVEVTGSPRLEAFRRAGERMTADERRQGRARVGATLDERLVVVATKYVQIEAVFKELVRAVTLLPGVRLVVKCHPAEAPAPYEKAASGLGRVRVVAAGADLPQLIACADVLVTVNSTAALEAMVLDVPSLVLALPSNLSPFVEAGAMAGVAFGDEIEPALRAILYDQEYRERLRRGWRAFMERDVIALDGHAADRAAAAIVRLIRHDAAKKERSCAH